jgi:hypothetical protein
MQELDAKHSDALVARAQAETDVDRLEMQYIVHGHAAGYLIDVLF